MLGALPGFLCAVVSCFLCRLFGYGVEEGLFGEVHGGEKGASFHQFVHVVELVTAAGLGHGSAHERRPLGARLLGSFCGLYFDGKGRRWYHLRDAVFSGQRSLFCQAMRRFLELAPCLGLLL